ncbi:adhesion G-protein coupled receptor G2-like [Clupea harengus]|uniref:Adhesion G-protein coupled receptor G2-like n=1 Tax=Clupea harengus TaxID=7950 RepID=A0A6P8GAS9_CLUHA|nr:adhesion G-protein coupled receptor G2-like [Clupea harengus]
MAVQLSYTWIFLWTTIAMSFATQGTKACLNHTKMVVINEVSEPLTQQNSTCSGDCSVFSKLCIYNFNKKHAPACNKSCHTEDDTPFIYNVTKMDDKYNLVLHKSILHLVNIWIVRNWTWMPSCEAQAVPAGETSPIGCNQAENCGDSNLVMKNISPSVECKDKPYIELKCEGTKPDYFILTQDEANNNTLCVTCENPNKKPEASVSLENVTDTTGLVSKDGTVSASKASAVMEDMKSILSKIGNASSAAVSLGEIKGVVQRLKEKKRVSIAYSAESKEMILVSNPNAQKTQFSWSVDLPAEAVNISQSANDGEGFASILRFPKMTPDVKNSTILNDAVYGISMGARISNLTDKINLRFKTERLQAGTEVKCNSWEGVGDQPNWTGDGCVTIMCNDSTITCECSHLTFFAILMSSPQPNGTITDADLNSLTYISYIGCGLSMFFLGVALFMHFLLRKGKSSQAIQILMNLFLALFLLDLTFLSNEWVANTGSYPGCIIIATLMHYSMLSTFTWFAMQALHLYLAFVRASNNKTYKNYMLKMCLSAWVCPAVVVIILACLNEYKLVTITTTSGYGAHMCWITNPMVHYVVNIGYYGVVFLFTLGIFFVIVQRIIMARKLKVQDAKTPSTSKNLMTIMSLFALLGLTWGVAFFSYGAMLIPSYYIFSILNAFQGLFLFIYYYNSSKVLGEDSAAKSSFKDSTSSNTAITNVYDNMH